jgi:uncharacterized membrane-anchored protein
MKKQILLAACIILALLPVRGAQRVTGITLGPANASLGESGKIQVPQGYLLLDGDRTRERLKTVGEPTSGNEVGWLIPTNGEYSVMFEFNPVGYIKDDEKDKLNADKLLASIKAGNDESNKEREKAGHPRVEVVGWDVPPHYDETTHNLEWAIRGTVEGQPLLNYNTRLLGRKGVMEVVLIVDPKDVPATLPQFKNLLAGYSFQSGQSYAEYHSGDKVAKYGLTALVVGGAAVGAAKLGLLGPVILLFKKAWKLVIVAFAAVVGFFKKMFRKITGKDREPAAQE